MPRDPQQWIFGYDDLIALTGLSLNSLHQHRRRGNFDPGDLGSIVLFVARHGHLELRREIIDNMLSRGLVDESRNRTRPTRKKKAIKKKRKKASR